MKKPAAKADLSLLDCECNAARANPPYAIHSVGEYLAQADPLRIRRVLAFLEPRLGRQKALVAIAHKFLVAVWHVLAEETADRFADPTQVPCSFSARAYKVGVRNLPEKQSALVFTRAQLDRLRLGKEVTEIPWGSKRFKLPPSQLNDPAH